MINVVQTNAHQSSTSQSKNKQEYRYNNFSTYRNNENKGSLPTFRLRCRTFSRPTLRSANASRTALFPPPPTPLSPTSHAEEIHACGEGVISLLGFLPAEQAKMKTIQVGGRASKAETTIRGRTHRESVRSMNLVFKSKVMRSLFEQSTRTNKICS